MGSILSTALNVASAINGVLPIGGFALFPDLFPPTSGYLRQGTGPYNVAEYPTLGAQFAAPSATTFNVPSVTEPSGFQYWILARAAAGSTLIGTGAFGARLTPAASVAVTTGSIQQLIFTSVTLNIENVYNATTGLFTAPKTGLYTVNGAIRFSSSGAAGALMNLVQVYLFKNGVNSGIIFQMANHASDPAIYQVGWSNSIIIPLSAGDTISLRYFVGGGLLIFVSSDSTFGAFFNGELN